MLEVFAYLIAVVVHLTDQNLILKTVYCVTCVMVCKIGFANWNTNIAHLRVSMVVTYYIIDFRMGVEKHTSILISLLLMVDETIRICLMKYSIPGCYASLSYTCVCCYIKMFGSYKRKIRFA